MHIPPHLLLPQDMVVVRDKGDDKSDPPVPSSQMVMHAADAKHAMQVEPERYELHDPAKHGEHDAKRGAEAQYQDDASDE